VSGSFLKSERCVKPAGNWEQTFFA